MTEKGTHLRRPIPLGVDACAYFLQEICQLHNGYSPNL